MMYLPKAYTPPRLTIQLLHAQLVRIRSAESRRHRILPLVGTGSKLILNIDELIPAFSRKHALPQPRRREGYTAQRLMSRLRDLF